MPNLEIFRCDCGSNDHLIIIERILWDLDSDDPETLAFSVALNDYLPWYKKILPAIKYIVGWDYKYAHFDEVLLKKSEVKRLINILTEWENNEN